MFLIVVNIKEFVRNEIRIFRFSCTKSNFFITDAPYRVVSVTLFTLEPTLFHATSQAGKWESSAVPNRTLKKGHILGFKFHKDLGFFKFKQYNKEWSHWLYLQFCKRGIYPPKFRLYQLAPGRATIIFIWILDMLQLLLLLLLLKKNQCE